MNLNKKSNIIKGKIKKNILKSGFDYYTNLNVEEVDETTVREKKNFINPTKVNPHKLIKA